MSLFGLADRVFVPAPPANRFAFLRGGAFAHRGLHGGDIVENSRAAFAAAIAGGFGIELDVQASRDHVPFVFHDRTLDRLTSATGPIGARRSTELGAIPLKGTSETIPSLAEVLALIAGRAPVLIEIKTGRRPIGKLCRAVRSALEGYAGPVAVMSFNPQVSRWFSIHAPALARGLVVTEEGPTALPDKTRAAVVRRFGFWRARPHFLAYDVRDLPARFASAQRARGLPVLTWTVRTPGSRAIATAHADAPIFEVEAP